jgi:hypothetical protein
LILTGPRVVYQLLIEDHSVHQITCRQALYKEEGSDAVGNISDVAFRSLVNCVQNLKLVRQKVDQKTTTIQELLGYYWLEPGGRETRADSVAEIIGYLTGKMETEVNDLDQITGQLATIVADLRAAVKQDSEELPF